MMLDSAPASVAAVLQNMQSKLFPRLFIPVKDLLDDICQSLDALAKDLEKPKPHLSIEVDELHLNRRGETLLRKIFIHILRNSMDHGLEKATERRELGKQEQGEIFISFKEEDHMIVLHYHDDGRGLHINRIRESARIQGLAIDPESLTVQECADLIFHSGLSTAVKINDISGRGVGMGAVKSYLQAEGGDIRIQLRDNVSTQVGHHSFYFVIKVPKSLFSRPLPPLIIDAA
ncbi:MAG: ATP-binding protein [Oligoflexus sp.]